MRSLIAVLALALATPAAASTWDIDTGHSMVGFVAKHLVFTKVHGRFESWSGKVTLDEKDITKSHVEVSIVPASITTENDKRDTHVKSKDFLDVKNFPKMSFVSTKVEKGPAADTLKVHGNLTMHGITKPVVLDVNGPSPEFKDPGGNAHRAFSATAKINRHDWKLDWAGPADAGAIVSDEIQIELDLELFHKKP